MRPPAAGLLTIVNVGYRSTNYWCIGGARGRLLIDLGWPGTLGRLRAELDRKGVPLHEIRYGIATHYHPDHAGLAQDLKNAGMTLVVVDRQAGAIDAMAQWIKPADGYTRIQAAGNLIVSCSESRALLERIGIAGTIVHTPGHSDDSVSVVLDDGSVFTGDLTPQGAATAEDRDVVADSWARLRQCGGMRVYPAHGPIRDL